MRRRRRRGAFSQRGGPQRPWIMIGAGALVLVGSFFFFLHQADQLAPTPEPTRIELPDALNP